MSATKRSRSSRNIAATGNDKALRENINNAVTNGKRLASEIDVPEKKARTAKRTKTEHSSANGERWTPYFRSKRLNTLQDGGALHSDAVRGQPTGTSDSSETAAMQECQSLRRAFIKVTGLNGHLLNQEKFRVEFDTGADDCLMTKSCYMKLKEFIKFKNGVLDIEGATEGETAMTQYTELGFNIGSINFPPGVRFWVDEALPEDAGFDVLLSGPFLAHHNVIHIDPRLQREIEKDGDVDVMVQKHFDFPVFGVNRPLTKRETKGMSHWR